MKNSSIISQFYDEYTSLLINIACIPSANQGSFAWNLPHEGQLCKRLLAGLAVTHRTNSSIFFHDHLAELPANHNVQVKTQQQEVILVKG